jgi:hypothetical protein
VRRETTVPPGAIRDGRNIFFIEKRLLLLKMGRF